MNEAQRNELSSAKRVLDRLVRWWRNRNVRYTYGSVFRPEDGHRRDNVRLDKKTGRVQFVLWKAGEQGHKTDYWYDMGYGWEDYFTPNT